MSRAAQGIVSGARGLFERARGVSERVGCWLVESVARQAERSPLGSVLAFGFAGALVGPLVLFGDRPWQMAPRNYSHSGAFALWAAAIAFQTGACAFFCVSGLLGVVGDAVSEVDA
jgi:hypothetical protein